MTGTLLSCEIEAIQTRADRTIKITLGTPELSPSVAGELFGMTHKIAAVYISSKETITQKELAQVDAINPEFEGKSPAQRMRNVLFILWNQDQQGYKLFDDFYKHKMEAFIESLKAKIQP